MSQGQGVGRGCFSVGPRRPGLSDSRRGRAGQAHVANMGRMVEEMENQMRDTVEEVYFGKTKNVVNGLYKLRGAQQEQTSAALQRGLMAEMQGKLGK